MASVPIRNIEPIQITAGDTLSFQRYFSDYPASTGWQLKYELRGNGQAIEFSSSANGDTHVLLVSSAITSTWLPAQYILEGYSENIAGGLRERIYKNNLVVSPNLEGSDPAIDLRTQAQKMIELIEGVQLGKFKHDILESDVEMTRIRRLTPKDLRDEYNYWKQIRLNEIRVENSKNGRGNQRNRLVVFTDPAGGGVGQYGALPPIYPFGGASQ